MKFIQDQLVKMWSIILLSISEDGIRYAVSNQWTADKMNSIISFAQSLGWKVESTNPLVSDNS